MSHYAKIEDGIVTTVIVAEQDFIDSGVVGDPAQWVQTSYNGNFRKRYAGIGFLYNAELDAFIPPKPHASWVLDEAEAAWRAPIPMPTDGLLYMWDEETLGWKIVPNISPIETAIP